MKFSLRASFSARNFYEKTCNTMHRFRPCLVVHWHRINFVLYNFIIPLVLFYPEENDSDTITKSNTQKCPQMLSTPLKVFMIADKIVRCHYSLSHVISFRCESKSILNFSNTEIIDCYTELEKSIVSRGTAHTDVLWTSKFNVSFKVPIKIVTDFRVRF